MEHDAATALTTLKPKHRAVAQLHLAGWTNAAIAADLGYAESYVSVIVGSPLFQEIVTTLREKSLAAALQRLEREADASVQAMVDVRDTMYADKGAMVRLHAAEKLLGRAIPAKSRFVGGAEKATRPATATHISLTADEIRELTVVVAEDDAALPKFRRTALGGPPMPALHAAAAQPPADIQLQTVDEAAARLRAAAE